MYSLRIALPVLVLGACFVGLARFLIVTAEVFPIVDLVICWPIVFGSIVPVAALVSVAKPFIVGVSCFPVVVTHKKRPRLRFIVKLRGDNKRFVLGPDTEP